MTDWRFVHFGPENDELELGGLPVWREEWRELPEPVSLSDPRDPSLRQRLDVFEIGLAGATVRFAAGEFSRGLWGFFIPADDWRYRVVDVFPGDGLGKVISLAGPTGLPAGTQVTVRLMTADGAVVETTGMKGWELAVDGPPFEQDAFLLPDVEFDIPPGALAEIAVLELDTGSEPPATSQEPPSPSSRDPAFVRDVRLPPEVERGPPEAASAGVARLEREFFPGSYTADELRTLFSPQERALMAAVGNAGLTSVVIGTSLDADQGLPEPARETKTLLPIGNKTVLALWVAYTISALYVVFRLKDVIIDLIMAFSASSSYGLSREIYETGPLIWLGLSIFYLAIGPVAILKLDRLRQIRE